MRGWWLNVLCGLVRTVGKQRDLVALGIAKITHIEMGAVGVAEAWLALVPTAGRRPKARLSKDRGPPADCVL